MLKVKCVLKSFARLGHGPSASLRNHTKSDQLSRDVPHPAGLLPVSSELESCQLIYIVAICISCHVKYPEILKRKVLKRLKSIKCEWCKGKFQIWHRWWKVIKEIINVKTKYVLCYASICLGFAYYQDCNTQKQWKIPVHYKAARVPNLNMLFFPPIRIKYSQFVLKAIPFLF